MYGLIPALKKFEDVKYVSILLFFKEVTLDIPHSYDI